MGEIKKLKNSIFEFKVKNKVMFIPSDWLRFSSIVSIYRFNYSIKSRSSATNTLRFSSGVKFGFDSTPRSRTCNWQLFVTNNMSINRSWSYV